MPAPEGPGAIEWVFLGDGEGMATSIVVDEAGQALVGGCRSTGCVNPWIARLDAAGTYVWERVDDVARSVADVTLDGEGQAIVVGSEFPGGEYSDAWIAAYQLENGEESWSVTQPSVHGLGSSSMAVEVLGDAIHVAIDSPISGTEREPSMTIFDLAGSSGAMRTWEIGYFSKVNAIAVDPGTMQFVQVGSWNTGNWIEALDANAQTLWTQNFPVEGGLGNGFVADVAIDAAGFVYVVGEERYHYNEEREWTVTYLRRFTADGQTEWILDSLWEGFSDIAVADELVYLVRSESGVGMWLAAHAAADGELVWEREVPREPDGPDGIRDLAVGPDSLWVAGFRLDDDEAMRAYVARLTR
jgi:hypothetical protein